MDPAPIFRAGGVDPAALLVPGKRVPVRTALRLWGMVEDAVRDPSFGIDVARQMHGAALHAVGYAWLSSATLGEAFRRFARYCRVLTELWRLRIDESGGGTQVSFVFAPGSPRPALWLHDWLVAGMVRLCRLTSGESFAPVEVALVPDPPGQIAPFSEWFRCPIAWKQDPANLLCRGEDLARSLPTANPDVALATEQVALEYLGRLDRTDLVAQVRRHVLEHLPSGAPTQAEIARRLAVSTRTLHRRLAQAGTSFEELLDETRRELAIGYLQRTEYSIAEVAYLLGFAQVSSFDRAFRRWTGRLPRESRGPE